jgi:hypothetical protein
MKQVGNKPEIMACVVKNADTVTIPQGAPVVLAFNGTDDGIAVVLPTTSTAQKVVGFQYGVALEAISVSSYGEAQVFGYCQSLQLFRQTRSDSTGNWASEAARSVGEFLGISSAINGWVTVASTTAPLPIGVLAQSLATYASSASATSDTRTAITASVKAFVRMM